MHLPKLNDFLLDTWVTSYTAFIHDLPQDKRPLIGATPADKYDKDARPPQLGAYYRDENTGQWFQTDGYYVSAALLVLRCDAASGGTDENPTGELTGYLRVNRGGRRITEGELVAGSYNLFHSPRGAVEGDIYFELLSSPANISIMFHWFAKSRNELEFWVHSSKQGDNPYRGNVSRGTLTRVVY